MHAYAYVKSFIQNCILQIQAYAYVNCICTLYRCVSLTYCVSQSGLSLYHQFFKTEKFYRLKKVFFHKNIL